jgi:hypothetical protein
MYYQSMITLILFMNFSFAQQIGGDHNPFGDKLRIRIGGVKNEKRKIEKISQNKKEILNETNALLLVM